MQNNEVAELLKHITANCFLPPMELLGRIAEKGKAANLGKEDCLTVFHWIYLDLVKEGENSFFHKNKARPLPDDAYICEEINMFLIARDQLNLMG